MFDQIWALWNDEKPAEIEPMVAAAALLVQAAVIDESIDAPEQSVIRRVLAGHFRLTPPETELLITKARQAQAKAVGLHRFTQQIIAGFDMAERIDLIEMLWQVVYADEVLTPEEDALIRRIAGLIGVDDHARGLARQQARAHSIARQS